MKQEKTDHRMFCNDCGKPYAMYMVKRTVWKEAWKGYSDPPKERDRVLCLDCLRDRLCRQLLPTDFNLDLIINEGIKLGIQMGSQLTQVNQCADCGIGVSRGCGIQFTDKPLIPLCNKCISKRVMKKTGQ